MRKIGVFGWKKFEMLDEKSWEFLDGKSLRCWMRKVGVFGWKKFEMLDEKNWSFWMEKV
jgi:hypothetical protein